jgi:predicted neuraminidase
MGDPFERRETLFAAGLYPSCHAATLTELADGTLLAAWYAGTEEKAVDVAIYLSRRETDGWSAPVKVVDTPERSEGNPVLFSPGGDEVWFWYVTMFGGGWDRCRIYRRRSLDGGRSWDEPVALHERLGWMTRNKPLRRRDGRLLLPLYDERDWTSFCLISSDGGLTGEVSTSMAAPCGLIQPTVVEFEDGQLVALLRTGGPGGWVWRSVSDDSGRTWTAPAPTSLPNPNCATDAVLLPDGWLVLCFNDSPLARTPLSLVLSPDRGISWPHRRTLESSPGEYSYPALVQTGDGLLHVLYTYRRETISHVTVSPEWITVGGGVHNACHAS